MKKKVKEELQELRRRVLRLRKYTQSFEEEVAVNSIRYMIQQAERVFRNRKGMKL